MNFVDIFTRVERKEEKPPQGNVTQEELSLLRGREEYNQQKEATSLMKWNRWLRIGFSGVIVLIVSFWLLIVAGIVCLSGIGIVGFHLESNVLITLIGGSSVNVIGLLAIIVHDIFPGNHKAK